MSRPSTRRFRLSGAIVVALLFASLHPGASGQSSTQSAAPSSPASPAAGTPQMSVHDNPLPIESQVNLVPVRVVVRDKNGKSIAHLPREDFRLLEDGKPQIISNFTEETPATLPAGVVPAGAPRAVVPADTKVAFLPPGRFVALLFDDSHLNVQDVLRARAAASRYIETDLVPTDRVAVFTVSGQEQTDFTDDRAKIEEDLKALMPRGTTTGDPSQKDVCPLMDYYEAVEIADYHDPEAMSVGTADAVACLVTQTEPGVAQSLTVQAQASARVNAQRIATIGDAEVASALRRLDEVTRRMSVLPGQRSIVFISPGFIYPNREFQFSELIDRALRENVFINTIDARGLYTPGVEDIKSWEKTDPNSIVTAEYREKVRINGEKSQMQMLQDLALGTGGLSIHDNNNLDAGLREIVSAPEAYYLLAFVPQNLKYDGHFHSLNVELTEKNDYTIQARKGFYSPSHGETPEQAATRDIMDALFSQEPHHGLPIALSTQFFKTSASDAKLTVLAHVDVAHVRFDKLNGLNDNDLTVATALFDRNGNFVVGTQKVVEMKLLDETVAKLSRTGVTIRTDFDVKPGDYVVRLVVRDGNSAQLATESGTVEIQF